MMTRTYASLCAACLLSAASVATAAPKAWTLDLGHAYVGWQVDHMNLSPTVGQFRSYDGRFLIDEEDPANSQISFTVQAISLDLHFDLVDCDGAPETNIPCHWGRDAAFKGPNE